MQSTVQVIFEDFDEWIIAIYDNILVLAEDFNDAFDKLKKVVDRCRKYNVFLKMAKTWLGFPSCEFFGFKCERNKYQLTEKRKASIMEIPFPTCVKQMRSFLGIGNFFGDFVPNFASLVAPLHDMTAKTFTWKQSEWTVDYPSVFERFKNALTEAVALFYPDYNLTWVLRTDASEHGVGWVLLQLRPTLAKQDIPEFVHEPILFGSKKFSPQAMTWDTFNQESYGIFASVKDCDYYVRAKPFILETDHANLQWMEKSTAARVIRMRVYLQNFSFLVRHIPRGQNTVADWQSKFYSYPVDMTLSAVAGIDTDVISETLALVHGGRAGHLGIKRTWELLAEKVPGHRIPYKIVYDFVQTCPICQKFRLDMGKGFEPMVRHLKVPDANSAIGIDLAEMGLDAYGNRYIHVVRNFFTKLISLYPTPDKSAESLAKAIFCHLTRYGLVNMLVSDPGSDLTSSAIALVNKWFGVHHRLSLVNRHESNGVEGGIKDATRFITTLCADERHSKRWSDISIIGWVEFIMNTTCDSETGYSPFNLTFGSKSSAYFKFPDGPFDSKAASAFLKGLNSDMEYLRAKSKDFQDRLVQERTKRNDPEKQNVYQKGDFVLYKPRQSIKPSRFTPKYEGPYEVISQTKNDVSARHVNLGITKGFFVEDLKIFHGTKQEAQRMAILDQDQYEIETFRAYRGDPHTRTTMEFLVVFKDGSEVWLPWSEDLFNTVQYELYCRSRPELFQLIFKANLARQAVMVLNKSPIDHRWVGKDVYVDLRCYGATWYASLTLPDKDFRMYVVLYRYERLERKNTHMIAFCAVFNERFSVDHLFIQEYGSRDQFNSTVMTLVDSSFAAQNPEVLPTHQQRRR
jgi:hypothetical protein